MDLSSWLWVVLFVSFGLGWLLARYDIKSIVQKKNILPVEYFKGLQYLLNEQPDKAVDAFIQVAKLDPETADLHLALGQMFRKRGEFTRSIRIHESLANRGLALEYQEKAYMALGEDYYKAGMFDRAENIFIQFKHHTLYGGLAIKYLLIMAKLQQNWSKAVDLAKFLPKEQAHKQVFHLNMQYIDVLLGTLNVANDNANNDVCNKLHNVFKSIPAEYQQHIRYQLAHIKWQEILQKNHVSINEIKRILLAQNIFNADKGINAAIYSNAMNQLIEKYHQQNAQDVFMLLDDIGTEYQEQYTNTQSIQEKESISMQQRQIFNIVFKLKLENLQQHKINADIVDQIHNLCQNKLQNDPNSFADIKIYAQFLLNLKNMHAQNVLDEKTMQGMYILLDKIVQHLHADNDKNIKYICQECGFRAKNFTWACHGCGEYESLTYVH